MTHTNKWFLILGFMWAIITSSCSTKEGFTDSQVFIQDFELRSEMLKETPYLDIFDRELSTEQRQALQFLYAYMPLPDITDYSGEFHLMNVDYALRTRVEMPWGKTVPDREFLHFVLPPRVNNENLDECRQVFFDELKERVSGLSMYDATLEVNHWCHEKVTYTPSDARTSSPLATIRTAHGRCGEESTFTVSALRAVGIPARQVYTPRWAHTDDNHAWVEAWIDGKWYFLGACEPEPVLNLGWFNAPASRGMLMHTNVFGKYNGSEEIVGRNACYTEINVTPNYAPTATTTVKVVDTNGNPVQAIVEFKIYNYAEIYSAATKLCDTNGTTSLTTGYGDMVVWASKDGMFGFVKVTAGKDNNIEIVLDKTTGYQASLTMDIVPPTERNTTPELTDEQIEQNKARFVYEDSIRNAYVATFPSQEEATALARELNTNEELTVTLIKQSRGNHATITEFLTNCPTEKRDRVINVLFEMSEKDRRDVSLDVLNDHCQAWITSINDNKYYYSYVLNPRVSNEMLTPYRSFFASVITPEEATNYRNNPEEWVEWCRNNIKVDNQWNPRSFCMSPRGVWEMRTTDAHSRDIFFVAAARSMEIPARIDEVTGKTQYLIDGQQWRDVNFEEENEASTAPTGILAAQYTPTRFLDNPRYYSHFSISRIVDGRLILQNYPESATWDNLLRKGTAIDAGHYMLMTGTRMADGSVMATLEFIQVPEDSITNTTLTMRQNENELQVIGNFNSESLFYDLSTEQQRSLLSATGRGYYILALIDPNSEPSNHFLRDIMPYKEVFESWGQKMVVLFENTDAASRFKADDFPNLPSTIVMGTDIDNEICQAITTAMKLPNNNRPIIIVADTFNRIVFVSQGYSIGLGEQLSKVINQLSEE